MYAPGVLDIFLEYLQKFPHYSYDFTLEYSCEMISCQALGFRHDIHQRHHLVTQFAQYEAVKHVPLRIVWKCIFVKRHNITSYKPTSPYI